MGNFHLEKIDLWEGDRYSIPTKHNRNCSGKIPAICDDDFPSIQAIGDSAKLLQLLDYWLGS
jgi:glutathione S-transferase